jgi:hypothetical protein
MASVVPQAATPEQINDSAVVEFREQQLSAQRFWRTRLGDRLLKWFWKSRFGRWFWKKFSDATPEDVRGYQFWGPVALVVLTAELLGLGKIASFDYWPTISTTIGHLQDGDGRWGLLVVGLIALAGFYAIAYQKRPPSDNSTEFMLKGAPGDPRAVHYGWRVVYLVTMLVAVLAAVLVEEKIHRGYWIYGVLALFGLIIPFVLASPWRGRHHVAFPNLFYTFSDFRGRFPPASGVVLALLAILFLHLALYPWPDLKRESATASATYAGSTARQARVKAQAALNNTPGVKPGLMFSTSQRTVSGGQDAWHVYFVIGDELSDEDCYVIVRKGREPKPTEDCSAGN